MATLTQTRSVMHREHTVEDSATGTGVAVFSDRASHDDGSMTDRELTLPAQDWRAMGEPEVITLTVQPGDLLNA